MLELLEAGKDVVTANKALLAHHGPEIFDAGRRCKKAIAFEASVGGGIPIIGALSHGLAANQILSLQGILNGTCNFIMTAMTEGGTSYAEALAEAQRRGYAEADPTLDVDGTDSAHKIAILAQIAFGVTVSWDAITRRGIADIHQDDIRYARELGYTIKLLAEAWLDQPVHPKLGAGQLALHVSPVMLRHLTPLAQVRDAYNAIFVAGDAVGSTLYYGRGAGEMPTASAVVADLIDLAAGRAQRTFEALRLMVGRFPGDRAEANECGRLALLSSPHGPGPSGSVGRGHAHPGGSPYQHLVRYSARSGGWPGRCHCPPHHHDAHRADGQFHLNDRRV